ncbi:DUF4145 domain-containing protein [Mucilaginibacter sp. X4EP1]|uniref:DUF4145 domain-containing protein n=1 Tax=Mucilaginibacter sp. X4EP1 TaxID=2723092 RepID=UPI002167389E|nr:DUF4145 domain-containing protein [Mucilaginibacter sp. X4EP1]MCS3811444.1 hypothetical protein [Mucilaginibacter sp. X4EP1]
MNKEIWTDWRINKPCPSCQLGRLKEHPKKPFMQSETLASENMTSQGYPYYDYVFTEHLKCDNCGEVVVALGRKSEDSNPNEEGKHDMFIKYLAFEPTPFLIVVPKSCPKRVKEILLESFSLFWRDENSCANKIRVSVEALMDALKIKKTKLNKKGRETLKLHARIMEFRLQNAEVADFLLAIKWIGNSGSHMDNITVPQLLDAYELMEYALELLYNDRKKLLTRKSKAINKRRKPI